MEAYCRREAVVFAGVARGLAYPEGLAEDGIADETGGEGLPCQPVEEVKAEGYIALAQGEGYMGIGSTALGYETHHKVGLPKTSLGASIMPAESYAGRSYRAGILQTGLVGNKAVPEMAVSLHTIFVVLWCALGRLDIAAVGGSGLRNDGGSAEATESQGQDEGYLTAQRVHRYRSCA